MIRRQSYIALRWKDTAVEQSNLSLSHLKITSWKITHKSNFSSVLSRSINVERSFSFNLPNKIFNQNKKKCQAVSSWIVSFRFHIPKHITGGPWVAHFRSGQKQYWHDLEHAYSLDGLRKLILLTRNGLFRFVGNTQYTYSFTSTTFLQTLKYFAHYHRWSKQRWM